MAVFELHQTIITIPGLGIFIQVSGQTFIETNYSIRLTVVSTCMIIEWLVTINHNKI